MSGNDLDTTITFSVDATGVEVGTTRVKRSLKDLGQAASETGKSTGSIGDGMSGASAKVEAATRNMIGSIQRQTAAMEAGDKSSRAYQESLARMRGVDVAALKPYLDQLDAMKAKQSEAARSAESFASGMKTVQMAALAAGAATGALIAFSKSIIDAADNLNDLSQRVGISVLELGKYKLAAEQSGSSLEAIAKGVKGLAGNMLEHGDALRKAGIDATTADGAMQQLADMFKAMPDGIEKTTLATKLFGKAGMDLIPMLNLGSEGLRDAAAASAEYAEQMQIMAPLADQLNDTMAEIALAAQTSGAIMVNEFLPALNQIAAALLESEVGANTFAKGFGAIINTVLQTAALLASDVAFVFKGMGREIGGIIAQFNALGEGGGVFSATGRAAWNAVGQAMREDAANARAELDKWQNQLVNGIAKASVSAYAQRQGIGYVASTDSAAKAAELLANLKGNSEAKKAIADANRELEAQAKLIAELNGLSGSFAEDWDRLSRIFAKGKMSLEELTKEQATLLAKQPFMVAAAKDQEKANKDLDKSLEKLVKDMDDYTEAGRKADADKLKAKNAVAEYVKGINDSAAALEFETGLMGQSAEARATAIEQNAIYAESLKKIADIMKDPAWGADTAARDAAIVDVQVATATKAATASGRAALTEWNKTFDRIESGLTDALMKGGKEGAQQVRELIVKELVMEPFQIVVRALLQPVTQGLANAAVSSVGGSAASSAGGSLLGNAVGSLAGAQAGAALSTGSGLIGQFASGFSGSASTAASLMGAEMTTAASLGSMVAASLPWVAGAMLIASLAGGETRSGAQYSNKGVTGAVNYTEGPSGGEIASEAARAAFTGAQDSINLMLKRVGSTATLAGFNAGLESSKNGKGFVGAGGTLSTGATFGDTGDLHNVNRGSKTAEQAMAEYVSELRVSVMQALQAATDIPQDLHDKLAGIDFNNISQAAFDAIEKSVYSVIGLQEALTNLPFENLKNLSFGAAEALLAAADGLDTVADNGLASLDALLTGYYDNFYSATEKTAQLTTNTAKAFENLGLVMPAVDEALRASYRAEVERLGAMDLGIEANAKAYASVLALQGSVSTLADAFDTVATAASKAQTDLIERYSGDMTIAQAKAALPAGIGDSLMTHTAEQARAAIADYVASLNPSTELGRAAIDHVNSLSGAFDVLIDALATAEDAAIERAQAVASERTGLEDTLLQLQGDTAELRRRELAVIDPTNRALQTQIWALEDAAAANDLASAAADKMAASATDMLTTLTTSADNAYAALQRSVSAQREIYQVQATAAQDAINEIKGIYDQLGSGVQSLYGQVDSAQTATAGAAFIASALSAAKATGYLPDAGDLATAISDATGQGNNAYATKAEADLYRLNLASQMSLLQDISGGQLSSAEAQLAAAKRQIALLDDTLETAQKQLDVAKGIDTSVLSVADAVRGLDAAIAALANAVLNPTTAASVAPAAGSPIATATAALQPGELLPDMSGALDYAAATTPEAKMALALYGATHGGINTAYYQAALAGVGGSYDFLNWDGKQSSTEKWRSKYGFASGINVVPYDMTADIHAGEAVVPAALNPFNPNATQNGLPNNDALIAEIRALRAEVAALKGDTSRTADNTKKLAQQFDAATEGGRAMQTEVYA